MKPLLASKADLSKVRYPVLCTPKLDGIRCLMIDGIASSRNLKPIPNLHIRKALEGLHGLDGELMVDGDFNSVQAAVMRVDGIPSFTYHVFDDFSNPEVPYKSRLSKNISIDNVNIFIVLPTVVNNEEELLELLEDYLTQGYEGLMLRDPEGKYKYGRSTVNEGILLKVKKFLDDEGTLIDIEERMINNNPKRKDALGHSIRSSHKENKVPSGIAGACVIQWKHKQFKVGFGPGFTNELKKDYWVNKENYLDKTVKFSYQELSKDGIPRFGKLLGVRHIGDM